MISGYFSHDFSSNPFYSEKRVERASASTSLQSRSTLRSRLALCCKRADLGSGILPRSRAREACEANAREWRGGVCRCDTIPDVVDVAQAPHRRRLPGRSGDLV